MGCFLIKEQNNCKDQEPVGDNEWKEVEIEKEKGKTSYSEKDSKKKKVISSENMSKKLAISGLIFGIVGIISCNLLGLGLCFGLVLILLSIYSLIYSLQRNKIAPIGILMGIVSIVLGVVSINIGLGILGIYCLWNLYDYFYFF